MTVSVILPVKDEPELPQFLLRLHSQIPFKHEVLVQREEGITFAVWKGLQKARGPIVVIMDGDGSHDPRYISQAVSLLNGKNVVLGYRKWNQYPFTRRFLSLACAWLTRNWLRLPYRDPLTAFIVGRKEAIKFEPKNGCKFALDIICGLDASCVVELPIIHKPGVNHKSKLKPIEGLYLLVQLVRLKREKLQSHKSCLGLASATNNQTQS